MQSKRITNQLIVLILLTVGSSACRGQQFAEPSSTFTATLVSSPSPAIPPTFIPTKTATASLTQTPMPIQSTYTAELIPLARYNIGLLYDLALSPDGQWLALGVDGGILIYDAKDLDLPPRFLGANINRTIIEFSPDGTSLAGSGRYLNYIYLWDTSTWEQVQTIGMDYYAARMSDLAFSPDNDLVSVSGSGAEPVSYVKFWNIKTGKLIRTLSSNNLQSAAFAPDGKTMATGTDDGQIILWDTSDGELLDSILTDSQYVEDLAFSPDGATLASTSGKYGKKGEYLTLWDVSTRQKISSLPGSEYYYESIAFSTDGETLATCCYEGNIILWDPLTGESKNELTGGGKVVFSPDGKSLAYGGGVLGGSTVTFWDTAAQEETQTISDVDAGALIAFAPDGKTLITYDFPAERMVARELMSGEPLHVFAAKYPGHGRSKFSSDGEIFGTAVEMDDNVFLWETTSWTPIGTFSGADADFDVSADNKMLATLGSDLVIWEIATSQQISTVACGRWMAECDAVAFSPDGKIIVLSSYTPNKPMLKILDASSTHEISSFENQISRVEDIVFSLDSKFFATIDPSSIVTIWDATNYEQIRTLGGYALGGYGPYRGVAPVFSPDGKVLASVVNNMLNLWNVETGDLTYTLYVPESSTMTFSFIFDGTIIVTGERNSGTVLYWGFAENLLRYPFSIPQTAITPPP